MLTADDEGRLAWEGAVARMDDPPEVVAVVDLGGGSCELAVGTPDAGPSGCARSTRARCGSRARSSAAIRRPRSGSRRREREIRALLESFDPPQPDAALAVGGTARAIGRIVGRRFGDEELGKLASKLGKNPAAKLTESYGITPERAETLLGGTLVLAETARRLG